MDREKRDAGKGKSGSKSLWQGRFLAALRRQTSLRKSLLLVGFSLAIACLLTPSFTVTNPSYRLGDVADRNLKAKRDFLIEDQQATSTRREEAALQAPLVYDLEENATGQVLAKVRTIFDAMRVATAQDNKNAPFPDRVLDDDHDILQADDDRLLQKRLVMEQILGFKVSDAEFLALRESGFSPEIEQSIGYMLKSLLDQGVVGNKTLLQEAQNKDLLIRKVHSKEEIMVSPPHLFPDLQEAQRMLRMQVLDQPGDAKKWLEVASFTSKLLKTNMTFSLSATEELRQELQDAVKPVYLQVKKNEMLVREGQKIGPQEMLRLTAYDQGRATQHPSIVFFSIFVFSGLCIWIVLSVARVHLPAYRMEIEDLVFLGVLLTLLLTLARFTLWVADLVGESSGILSGETLIYAIPLTAGAMMASIFFGVTVSLIFSLVTTIFAGMLFGMDFWLFFYFLLGSFVAAHGVTPCRTRMIPIKAGLLVGCANVILIGLRALLQENDAVFTLLVNSFFGFCGGVFSGILVTGLTPLAEMIFGYTTDIKLLELATMDQPLLQELMMQAPGTYHHSIIVGNMAEGAAKSIGANSLLAKVAGYYHDIGKIKKPHYFIENQFDCQNPHQKLAPSMSSLILMSHVKEGGELARQNRLGRSIIDIISQHHGTSFISFFYNKALESREKAQSNKRAELPPINSDDYRYPGPKPQTKEAGLVMLADVVEAACRSLTDPTPARIKGMVNRLINSIFSDGQLEECELTLKDLHQIAKHFNQVLATVHHRRVEYPAVTSTNGKVKIDAGDSSQRESRPDRDRSGQAREGGKGNLKRLGLH